jgi:HSP20 family protein
MSLIKWNPWREMEDFFNRYSPTTGLPQISNQELMSSGDWSPRVDIAETDKEFSIKAEIPDVNKEDVKVTVENGVLSITGERKQEKEEKGKKFHKIERYYGSFTRSFVLPSNVDDSNIKADYKDGVLRLKIPKTNKNKSNSIKVSVN